MTGGINSNPRCPETYKGEHQDEKTPLFDAAWTFMDTNGLKHETSRWKHRIGGSHNYGRTPLVPILWQNIGLAVLAVAAIGAAIYLLVA